MPAPEPVSALIRYILDENPMHKNFMQRALAHITEEERKDLSTYLAFCIAQGNELPYLAQCYLTVVEDTLREQLYFMQHKEYRHETHAEVANHVYHDVEYMNRYMYGLAITAFFWPNHVDMARVFRKTLPARKHGRYLEIGPGHGYYLMTAMRHGTFDEFLGIDISEASIRQTKSIVDYFAPDRKECFVLEKKDFLEAADLKPNSFDAIVMGEVLEHVEAPDAFLRRMSELAKPDAYIFVTTCINAPAIDHIYLWRTTEALEEMIESSGLKIKSPLRLPYEGKTLEESEKEALAVNVAYVLEKS